MEITLQELTSIFASRPGWFTADKQAIKDTKFLLENKYLFLNKKYFCKKEIFLSTLEKLYSGDISIFDVDGGKVEHMTLKAIVLDMYNDKKIQVETHFGNRIPDLMYKEHEYLYIIECGNTDVNKIIEYFSDKIVREINIIPFPYADETDLYMYTFTPSDNLCEFLAFWKAEKLINLKNTLRKNS